MDFFTHVTLLSGLAVLLVQQVLKLNFIPLAFANKYPVPTNILLSIVTAFVVVWKDQVAHPNGVWQWIGLVTVIAVTAAVVYNQLISRWTELRATEGPGTK